MVNAGGQRLALAPSTVPGDTELTAETLVLTSVFLKREPLLAGAPEHGLGWYPKLDRVDAVLPSAAVLTGKRTPVSLQLFEKYLDNGFPARGVTSHDNKGEVFARIVTGTPPLAMSFSRGGSSSAASGGFLSPDLAVQGLSRLTGPVGGTSASSLDGVAKGQFARRSSSLRCCLTSCLSSSAASRLSSCSTTLASTSSVRPEMLLTRRCRASSPRR